jgi:hypothetical protein
MWSVEATMCGGYTYRSDFVEKANAATVDPARADASVGTGFVPGVLC